MSHRFSALLLASLAVLAPAVAIASPLVDASFRGTVTYTGGYSGSYQPPAPRHNPANQAHLNMGGLQFNVPTDMWNGRPALKPEQGTITFTLTFDRGRVWGTYTTTGELHPGSVQGRVEDGYCTLYDNAGGAPWSGPCDSQGFAGSNPANAPGTLTFRTSASSVIDQQERDRQLAQQRQLQLEQQREQEKAAHAKLARLSPLGRKIETVLEQDASSWSFNHYDIASVHDVRRNPPAKGKPELWAARYTYNNGQEGAVKIHVVGGQVSCLEFFDQQGECRPLGQSLSRTMMTEVAKGMFSGGSGRSESSGCDDKCVEYQYQAMKIQQDQQQNLDYPH